MMESPIINFRERFLQRIIFRNKILQVDGWSILHIILFFILGTQFPNQWRLVIIGTIIFEVFEMAASKRTSFFKENTKDTFTDILLNFVGYWIGSMF